MTTDITFGKLNKRTFNEVLKEKLDNEYSLSFKDTFSAVDFLEVEKCPDEKDGCSEKDTLFPNSAYRSGSSIAINKFFNLVMPDVWERINRIHSNDFQIALLKPLQEMINKAEYNGDEYYHKMRLHWFKFWTDRTIKLYGNDAVVSLS